MAELQNRWESEKQEKTQIQAEMDLLRNKYENDMASIDKAAENVTSPGQMGSGKLCHKCDNIISLVKHHCDLNFGNRDSLRDATQSPGKSPIFSPLKIGEGGGKP